MKTLLLLLLAVSASAQVGPISGGSSGGSVNGQAITPVTVDASTITASKALLIGTTIQNRAFNMDFISGDPVGPLGATSIFRISSGSYAADTNAGEAMIDYAPRGTIAQLAFVRAHGNNTGAASGIGIRSYYSNGTIAAPTSVIPGGAILNFTGRPHDGTAYNAGVTFEFKVGQSTATGSVPTELQMRLASVGATAGSGKFFFSSFGGLGINLGTSASPTAQLDVQMSPDSNSTAFALKISSQNAAGILSVAASGAVVVSTFTKTYVGGSAYVCVSDAGLLFASEGVCP